MSPSGNHTADGCQRSFHTVIVDGGAVPSTRTLTSRRPDDSSEASRTASHLPSLEGQEFSAPSVPGSGVNSYWSSGRMYIRPLGSSVPSARIRCPNIRTDAPSMVNQAVLSTNRRRDGDRQSDRTGGWLVPITAAAADCDPACIADGRADDEQSRRERQFSPRRRRERPCRERASGIRPRRACDNRFLELDPHVADVALALSDPSRGSGAATRESAAVLPGSADQSGSRSRMRAIVSETVSPSKRYGPSGTRTGRSRTTRCRCAVDRLAARLLGAHVAGRAEDHAVAGGGET